MSFPRYPAYKEVPIPWICQVPEHWQWNPIFAAARERGEDNKGMKEDNLLSLSYGSIVNKDINTSDGLLPESFETYQIVRLGDIVLRLTDLQNDKRSLRSALVTQTGIITSAYLALEPKRIDSRYLNYLLRAYDVAKVFYSMGGGLRQSMKYGDIKRMPLVIPSKAEQQAIVNFLDHETARIDALIAEQQRLIELLQEKRQAVISYAVTKGLNPDAPMKDSGVEWLGEVPEHWEIKKLKYVSPQITVGIVVEPSKYYVDDGVPALRSLNVSQGKIRLENLVFISENANKIHEKSRLSTGDLVAVRSGQPGTTAVIESDLDGCNCVDLIIIRKPFLTSSLFLSWYLASDFAKVQFSSGSGGAIQQHFNVATAAELIIPVPPKEEQADILQTIELRISQLDLLGSQAQQAVTLLQERRSALISSAVTGQIDVRGLVPLEAAA
ncbi:restriction endonuclease subunit S [Cyanobium gracile UHCC 0139]|uniref:Restriction endonuclease subunit S n=1 Tax=Cyanobium gracile UHCC 0139 TaxID=3110308 RepID=A0ABU5RTR3_9CYAN|nr:restriction endonuclease subunit S [Cyanobium gracile]MEA5391156.1 restriction endonuclease subunit S [Cyanobium gracile UHCC 0139]